VASVLGIDGWTRNNKQREYKREATDVLTFDVELEDHILRWGVCWLGAK
jgi:hypothetical protein